MRPLPFLFSCLILASLVGCGHKKLKYADEPSLHEGLQVSVLFLKPKSETIDMKLSWRNTYKHPVSFTSDAMSLDYEGAKASPKGKQYTISLAPDETASRLVIFNFGRKVPPKGTATLTIEPLLKGTSAETSASKLPSYRRALAIQ